MTRWLLSSVLVLSLGCAGDDSSSKKDPNEQVDPDPNEQVDPDPNEQVDPDPNEQIESGLTYHKDIEPLLEQMCVRCHSEGGIREQVPLTGYEEVSALAPLIKEQVTNRIMPPWQAADGCRDYHFDESLTEAEIATLSEWADSGAVEGAADVTPAEVTARQFATLTREDVTIEMPVDYVMTQSPDEYRCFLLDWPEAEPTFITGFGARPGNATVVHHVIAYLVPPDLADTFQKYDDDEDGPGYTCFGGPAGGSDQGMESPQGVRFLGGWAPGGVGGDFPPDTGMPVEPGSKIALQLHYNTLTAEPQADRTSVVFKVDEDVKYPAFVMPWSNFVKWILQGDMKIPAGEADVVHSYSNDPWNFLQFLQDGTTDTAALRIYSAALHMHVLGTQGRVWVDRASGESECLLDIPNYDFGWQRSYGFQEPVVVKPGDQLGIECHWDNTAENQQWVGNTQLDPVDQSWGEGTTDEMCVGFFYVVPLTEDELE